MLFLTDINTIRKLLFSHDVVHKLYFQHEGWAHGRCQFHEHSRSRSGWLGNRLEQLIHKHASILLWVVRPVGRSCQQAPKSKHFWSFEMISPIGGARWRAWICFSSSLLVVRTNKNPRIQLFDFEIIHCIQQNGRWLFRLSQFLSTQFYFLFVAKLIENFFHRFVLFCIVW